MESRLEEVELHLYWLFVNQYPPPDHEPVGVVFAGADQRDLRHQGAVLRDGLDPKRVARLECSGGMCCLLGCHTAHHRVGHTSMNFDWWEAWSW
jgi:hypothetical protein